MNRGAWHGMTRLGRPRTNTPPCVCAEAQPTRPNKLVTHRASSPPPHHHTPPHPWPFLLPCSPPSPLSRPHPLPSHRHQLLAHRGVRPGHLHQLAALQGPVEGLQQRPEGGPGQVVEGGAAVQHGAIPLLKHRLHNGTLVSGGGGGCPAGVPRLSSNTACTQPTTALTVVYPTTERD